MYPNGERPLFSIVEVPDVRPTAHIARGAIQYACHIRTPWSNSRACRPAPLHPSAATPATLAALEPVAQLQRPTLPAWPPDPCLALVATLALGRLRHLPQHRR